MSRMPPRFLSATNTKSSMALWTDCRVLGSLAGNLGQVRSHVLLMLDLTQTQGKTSYIHLRMVGSMINGEPFLYQSLRGTVYHVSDTITKITSLPSGSGDIVAYVDADEKKFEPQMFIRHPRSRLLRPHHQGAQHQPWLKQMGNVRFPLTFATALWTDSELFVTGFVISLRV
jgi:hypothetical protein